MSEVVEHAKEIGRTILPYWPVAAIPLGLMGFSKFLSWLIPGAHHNAKLDVRDKTVLITGASSGLGRALAFEFYKRGAKVIVVARSIDKLSQLCAELESAKAEFGWKNQHEPVYRYLDLSELGDEVSAKQQIDDLKSLAIDGKTIDVLVNNAGMSMRGGCIETPIRIQRQLMDINFFGHVLITKLLYDSIPDDGAIIVINSLQGKVALPYRSAYSASKHALQAFFDSLRAEDRPNLQILTINAGYINTGFGSRAVDAEGRAMGKEDQNQVNGMSPEDAASTIVKALIRRESELLMASFKHRLAIALRYFTPNLLNWLLHKRGQADPHRKAE
uniref:Dehydrogenase/reductase SDR family protein 7-like n=1 Tax=Panagrolaimus sp. JU765 TaxID=591449 RepID=A0AC34QN79_9BILA